MDYNSGEIITCKIIGEERINKSYMPNNNKVYTTWDPIYWYYSLENYFNLTSWFGQSKVK